MINQKLCIRRMLLYDSNLQQPCEAGKNRRYSQNDEVFRCVWFKCKFLTVENFESIALASGATDLRRTDVNREKSRVLQPECLSQGEIWLLGFIFFHQGQKIHQYVYKQKIKCSEMKLY